MGLFGDIAKASASIICIGGLAFGLVKGCQSMGAEVYRGKIGNKQVVYEEGRFSFSGSDSGYTGYINMMTITDGNSACCLYDPRHETSIDWENDKKPNFEKDRLEGVCINGKDYLAREDANSFVFDEMNTLYNDLRTQIRKKLREDLTGKIEKVKSGIDSNSR